ncbi:hypothetical protein SAM23877_3562 [Streptomyces ambofaciens ATCC 23877]|uniref:Uncharacterized protein n=1 Tax=Streptomyces ambofaciens (strain ATCC 23877 / 3486 / DSM 40053 / JCM 4204 / NBRC 12836 / NRRL B-2516) TaxID=278992 RepID=A0A0K2AUC6_STRA7|nr:hypothetical protein SAM23877_3562 [Streptomyces ambofaciens ATCC 23877]
MRGVLLAMIVRGVLLSTQGSPLQYHRAPVVSLASGSEANGRFR